jgi:hypothetical protein
VEANAPSLSPSGEPSPAARRAVVARGIRALPTAAPIALATAVAVLVSATPASAEKWLPGEKSSPGITNLAQLKTALCVPPLRNAVSPCKPDGEPPPKPKPYPVPAFAPARYTFTILSFQVLNTRSRHEDTDHVSASLGNGATPTPQTLVKHVGDVNNGVHPVNLTLGPITVSDPNIGISFTYAILNNGHQSNTLVEKALTSAAGAIAAAGAKAATAAIGAAVGAQLGTVVLPVIGTALGLAAGWLVSQLGALLFANCDGPVALEEYVAKGANLWAVTHVGPIVGKGTVTTYHPGIDSPAGCGSNSVYTVTYQIARVG